MEESVREQKHTVPKRWKNYTYRIHVYIMAESLRYPPETISTLFIGYAPTQNKKFKKRKKEKKQSGVAAARTGILKQLGLGQHLLWTVQCLSPAPRSADQASCEPPLWSQRFGQVEGLAHCLHSVAPEEEIHYLLHK